MPAGGKENITSKNAGRILGCLLLTLALSGCAVTYVPVSWELPPQVRKMTFTDEFLKVLYQRYDPQRQTLRIDGASFQETMTPKEAKKRLGAYRQDTKLVYKNLYIKLDDTQLRDLIAHEMSHHVWFSFMKSAQREAWRKHLADNPSPLQEFVVKNYEDPATHDAEFFAFVVSNPRPIDLRKLAELSVISSEEAEAIIRSRAASAAAPAAGQREKVAKLEDQPVKK